MFWVDITVYHKPVSLMAYTEGNNSCKTVWVIWHDKRTAAVTLQWKFSAVNDARNQQPVKQLLTMFQHKNNEHKSNKVISNSMFHIHSVGETLYLDDFGNLYRTLKNYW